jgi:hypothetical protein
MIDFAKLNQYLVAASIHLAKAECWSQRIAFGGRGKARLREPKEGELREGSHCFRRCDRSFT